VTPAASGRSPSWRSAGRGLLLLAFAPLFLLPTPAQAHGIRGDAAGLSTYEFVGLGIEHMALGGTTCCS
jgi:hypothetical protein